MALFQNYCTVMAFAITPLYYLKNDCTVMAFAITPLHYPKCIVLLWLYSKVIVLLWLLLLHLYTILKLLQRYGFIPKLLYCYGFCYYAFTLFKESGDRIGAKLDIPSVMWFSIKGTFVTINPHISIPKVDPTTLGAIHMDEDYMRNHVLKLSGFPSYRCSWVVVKNAWQR